MHCSLKVSPASHNSWAGNKDLSVFTRKHKAVFCPTPEHAADGFLSSRFWPLLTNCQKGGREGPATLWKGQVLSELLTEQPVACSLTHPTTMTPGFI